MSEYKQKYLKYKLKYIELKKKQKILKGGSSYVYKSKFGSKGSGNGQFKYPFGITVLKNGDIAVCDYDNNNIQIFDSSGNYKSQFGSKGSGNGQFNHPYGITVLLNGDIAVSDNDNSRIQIFDSSGNYKSQFGSKGSGNGQFDNPYGIAVLLNGDIAVCDHSNSRIQIFDILGNYKSHFGSKGSDDGQFKDPMNLIVLKNGDIAVNDSGNYRIQIFDSSGKYKSQFGSKGSGNGKFNDPYDMTILQNGDIAVCDYANNNIQIFDSTGNYKSQFGSYGSGYGQFKGPNCLTILQNGDIAVNDSGNYRIQIFSEEEINLQTVLNRLNSDYNRRYLHKEPKIIIPYYIDDSGNRQYTIKLDIKNKRIDLNIFFGLYVFYKEILMDLYYNEKLKFQFRNIEADKPDIAIDAGGLTNNIFYLLSEFFGKIESNNYFTFNEDSGMYNLNFISIGSNQEKLAHIYFIGQLFGLAVKLRQIISIKLDMFLLFQMIKDDFNSITSKEIKKIITNYNPTLLKSNIRPYACYEDCVYPQICKYNYDGMEIKNKQIADEATVSIKKFYEENKNIVNQFVNGFRQQIDIYVTHINMLSLKDFNELIYGIETNDYDSLSKFLNYKGFDDNEKKLMEKLIKDNICGEKAKGNDWIGIFLLVITGRNRIPIGGYQSNYPLTIELIEQMDKEFDIHTCFNKMEIKKSILNDYKNSSNKKDTQLYKFLEYDNLVEISKLFNAA